MDVFTKIRDFTRKILRKQPVGPGLLVTSNLFYQLQISCVFTLIQPELCNQEHIWIILHLAWNIPSESGSLVIFYGFG